MKMRIVAVLVALGLSLASGPEATAQSTEAINVCGRLVRHDPATAERTGLVIVGGQKFGIAADVGAVNGGTTVEAGRVLCMTASLETGSIYLRRYTFYWWPVDDRICGNVVSYSQPTGDGMVPDGEVAISAYFGLTRLVVPDGTDIGTPVEGERVCYRIAVDEQGAAAVTSREAAHGENDLQRITRCGIVHEHSPATAGKAGSIEIGSRRYVVAAGVKHITDAAGPVPDPTVGRAMCLSASLDASGALASYLMAWMQENGTGTPAGHTASSATTPGEVRFGTLTLEVSPGADAGLDLSRGNHCYTVGLDEEGDAVVERIAPCEIVGRAAGPGRDPAGSTPVTTLPSTSTSALPEADMFAGVEAVALVGDREG